MKKLRIFLYLFTLFLLLCSSASAENELFLATISADGMPHQEDAQQTQQIYNKIRSATENIEGEPEDFVQSTANNEGIAPFMLFDKYSVMIINLSDHGRMWMKNGEGEERLWGWADIGNIVHLYYDIQPGYRLWGWHIISEDPHHVEFSGKDLIMPAQDVILVPIFEPIHKTSFLIPRTGDYSKLGIWFILFAWSIFGSLLIRKKTKSKKI